MSSPKGSSRRALLQALAAGLALAPLAACGFRPLYGRPSTNTASGTSATVDQQMASVRISSIANRSGQELHNALRDRFNPLGQPASYLYTLDVKLTKRRYGALARQDLSASRRNVEMTAVYALTDASGKTVLATQSQTTTGYDEFDDPLNDISGEEDATRRALLQLADMIRNRVAVALTPGALPAPAPAPAAAPTSTTP